MEHCRYPICLVYRIFLTNHRSCRCSVFNDKYGKSKLLELYRSISILNQIQNEKTFEKIYGKGIIPMKTDLSDIIGFGEKITKKAIELAPEKSAHSGRDFCSFFVEMTK